MAHYRYAAISSANHSCFAWRIGSYRRKREEPNQTLCQTSIAYNLQSRRLCFSQPMAGPP